MVLCLMSIMLMFGGTMNVYANDGKSLLPEEFDMNVTYGQIEDSILEFIQDQNLDIIYGSGEYKDFLKTFLYENEIYPLDENIEEYYFEYAALYLNTMEEGNTFKDNRDKTLNDIKEQNEDLLTLNDALNINETKSLEARDARKGSLEQAKEYARQYAINPSVKYQYFNQDCTNFASQILYEGWGMPTTSEWNTWSSSELAQRNWRVAHDFAEYWSVIKGYNGGVLPTREQVNQQANPGDFLAYMSRNTGVITHIAFVQEKRAG